MYDKALEALYVAANAIRAMDGVKECAADNDHKSGEIMFTLNDGSEYVLLLKTA